MERVPPTHDRRQNQVNAARDWLAQMSETLAQRAGPGGRSVVRSQMGEPDPEGGVW